jgi:hypothetical protein
VAEERLNQVQEAGHRVVLESLGERNRLGVGRLRERLGQFRQPTGGRCGALLNRLDRLTKEVEEIRRRDPILVQTPREVGLRGESDLLAPALETSPRAFRSIRSLPARARTDVQRRQPFRQREGLIPNRIVP